MTSQVFCDAAENVTNSLAEAPRIRWHHRQKQFGVVFSNALSSPEVIGAGQAIGSRMLMVPTALGRLPFPGRPANCSTANL